MPRSLVSLFLCLVVTLAAVAAHAEDHVLFVLVDVKQHRAYVPEGSVLPPGLAIRAEKTATRLGAGPFGELGRRTPGRLGSPATPALKRPAGPPFVFEYAPVERFEHARAQFEAKKRSSPTSDGGRLGGVKASEDRICNYIYVTDVNTGVYGSYTNGFTALFCRPSSTTPGNAYLWEFSAIGDYSDDDQFINPYAWIHDLNNHFNCYKEVYWSGDDASCTASATTTLLQSGCLNTVYTVGVLYIIEWLPGYEANYLGYSFYIDFCTFFY